jgi:hypothetical protein
MAAAGATNLHRNTANVHQHHARRRVAAPREHRRLRARPPALFLVDADAASVPHRRCCHALATPRAALPAAR